MLGVNIVFWLYNFLLGMLLNAGFTGVDMIGPSDLEIVYVVVVFVWGVWELISLWWCVFNVEA